MGFFDKIKNQKVQKIDMCVYAPVNGSVRSLASVNDGMFSEKILGDGIAIAPTDGNFVAPVSGVLENVFETGHAYGLLGDNGVEILIHIGLDTVELKGQGFQAYVKPGQRVKIGDRLATVDLETVKKAGYNPVTMIIITSEHEICDRASEAESIAANAKLLEVK